MDNADSTDRSIQKSRLRKIVALLGLVVIAIIVSLTVVKFTSSPEFCISCHEMKPEYYTWKLTTHKVFTCNECHVGPGLVNTVVHKISALREVYLHFTGTYDSPIVAKHPIPNSTCKSCHSPDKRPFSASGDLIIPHDKHEARGILCVDCHSGVAHGAIAARKVTSKIPSQTWDEGVARKQITKKYTAPKMNTCLQCHAERGINTQCRDCHKKIMIPDNHKQAEWMTKHGPMAREDVDYCNGCHSYSMPVTMEGTADVKYYARNNAFCSSCHQETPPGHTPTWKVDHPEKARGDQEGCLTCHNEERKDSARVDEIVVSCSECHEKTTLSSQEEIIRMVSGRIPGAAEPKSWGAHPKLWRKIHPTYVKRIGVSEGRCFDCHGSTSCSRCHTQSIDK